MTNSQKTEILNEQWDKNWGETDGEGNSFVVYGPEGQKKTATKVGVINSTGTNAIEIYSNNTNSQDNSVLQIEKGVAVVSNNARGIFADTGASKIYLDQSYICHSKGGVALHNGATLMVNQGAVIANNTADQGGGIYADSTHGNSKIGSSVILNEGCLITSNTAAIGGGISIGGDKEFGDGHDSSTEWSMATKEEELCSKLEMNGGIIEYNTATHREGGGIALIFNSSARAVLRKGKIRNNKTISQNESSKDWGGGGVFASQGTFLWMPEGAEISGNTSAGLGGGLTGCSTGKIIIDQNLNIHNNTANGTSFTAGSDKQKDQRVNPDSKSGIYTFDRNYRPDGYEYWKGDDIFGAEKTQVITSDNVQMKGIADGQKVVVPGGSTIKSSDWLTLTDINEKGNGNSYELQITGNTSATHGGGVLINGWLVSGSSSTIVVGDDIGINAKKSLVNLAGNTATSNKTFKFVITDSLADNAEILSEGSVTGSGAISFSQRLAVKPSEVEASNQAEGSTLTATYYLRERKEDSSIVKYDNNVYKLNFLIRCTSSKTVYRPVWNSTTEVFESKEITIKEFSIESLTVYKRLDDSQNFTKVTNINNISGTLKNVDLSNLQESNTTFKNTLIDKQKISVEKRWSDQVDHSKDYVTVYLKRYPKVEGQSTETAQIVKAITLNSQEYKGSIDLPDGVSGEAAGKDIWKYTWEDEFPLLDGNTEYVYSVEEDCSNKLYAGLITNFIDINNRNTQSITQVEALIPATSFQIDNEYYLVSPNNDTILDLTQYQRNDNYWITDRDRSSLKKIPNVQGDVIAFEKSTDTNLNNWKIKYSGYDGKSDGGLVIHPGNPNTNEGWIFYNEDSNSKGLKIAYSDIYKGSNTSGYKAENGYLQINQNNSWKDVTYNNNTFGVTDKNNGGDRVRVYVLGTVDVLSGGTTIGSATQHFVITNSKAPDLRFTLNIIKQDSVNSEKLLPGAEFKLSRIDGEVVTEIKVTGSVGSYSIIDGDSSQGTTTLITDETGKISISGLQIGKYELEETKAPDGYTLPHDAADRKLQIDINGESTELDPTNLSFTKEITNTLLTYELPETGSAGTKIYTATGTILLLTGTSLYRYKRRRRRKGGEAH